MTACRESVMQYTQEWNDLTRQMGYWVDMDAPYVTYQPKYMESVWWLLSQMHQKGLLYKGYTIQPYSPKAGTGLSSHELNQPGAYRDVTDTTVVAQFRLLAEDASPGQTMGWRRSRRSACGPVGVDDHAMDLAVQHGIDHWGRDRLQHCEDRKSVYR